MNLTFPLYPNCTTRILRSILVICLAAWLSFTPAAPGQAQSANSQPASLTALNFTRIDAGDDYTCALTSTGGVKCWGNLRAGQTSIPVDVGSLTSGVTDLSTGLWHTCAVVGGAARCWGSNFAGQLGDGTTDPRTNPTPVSGLTSGVSSIAAGNSHTCAVVNGGVKCWGDNQAKQLGAGLPDWQVNSPVDVVGLTSGVQSVAAGEYHTCALMDADHSHAVKCWGWNTSGQLGDSTTDNRPTPVDVGGLTGVTALAAADFHTCALISGGGVKCWGDNGLGQIGDNTTIERHAPTSVSGLGSGVTSLSTGRAHTCAVVGGAVKCWGDNSLGQLGDGSVTQRNAPVTVSGLTGGLSAVAAGGRHSCALLAGGAAKCWGDDNQGQLGDGTTVKRGIPVDVSGLAGVTSLAAGYQYACATPDSAHGGGVKCWGDNTDGQLGDGTTTSRGAPVSVSGLSGAYTALAAGRGHTCTVTPGGTVKCWGQNNVGQLGNGTNTASPTPVNVSSLTGGIKSLSASWYHTCALTTGGAVKCWGDNGYGEIGDGTNTQRRTPADVTGLSGGVLALASGDAFTCAVMDMAHGGGVKCWGSNSSGQLGDGSYNTPKTPVDVGGLSGGVQAVAAGGSHVCAVTSTGGVSCWGDGVLTPEAVPGLSSITGLGVGSSHNCALAASGGVKCAGVNSNAQLGDGSLIPRAAPADVSGLTGSAAALVAGIFHTCARMSDGGVKCWGSDGLGQLGLGTLTQRLTPVDVVESVQPQVWINHTTGKPGSTFTLTGWNFPASRNATFSANGHIFAAAVPVNPLGSCIFFLTTANAGQGMYNLSLTSTSATAPQDLAVSANPGASANLFLYNLAPLRLLSGGGQTLDLPTGLGGSIRQLYLPLAVK